MRQCCWVLLLSSVLAMPASAQETRGNISGTVKDAQGVVPGATVTITSTDTGASQPLVTNGRGYFEAPLVQPGNYQISVTMTGYNYAAYNNPVTDPTNSNFGKVTTAVASA